MNIKMIIKVKINMSMSIDIVQKTKVTMMLSDI